MIKQPNKKDNRGGKRKNQTGRPKVKREHSASFKEDVSDALVLLAELSGKTYGMVLAETAWGVEIKTDKSGDMRVVKALVQDTVRLAAQKQISEILAVKESKHTIEKNQGPQIFLPAKKEWDGQEKEIGKEGQGREEGAETGGKVLRH